MKRCNLVAEYTNIKYEQSRRIYGNGWNVSYHYNESVGRT